MQGRYSDTISIKKKIKLFSFYIKYINIEIL